MRYAQPGDPLVTNRGQIIPAVERGPRVFSLTTPDIKTFVPRIRRSGKELPAEPQTQTVINAILMYKLLGMSENEMSVRLGTSIDDVMHVINLPAFQETFELVHSELLSANSSSLQARLASYAGDAIENIVELANYKPEVKTVTNEETGEETIVENWKVPAIVKLKANQDVLDRSGLHPDTLFGKNAQQDEGNTLQIEIVTEQDNKTSINIRTNK